MTDHPILFSGPMVRALLEGRKTQTRRVLKPQPPTVEAVKQLSGTGCHWARPTPSPFFRPMGPVWAVRQLWDGNAQVKTPYHVGDRLWVRETWRTLQKWDHLKPSLVMDDFDKIDFAATGFHRNPLWAWGKSRPSIFLPRWASRLTLTVTDVRVQQLQEISEEDAMAEGAGSLESHMPGTAFISHVEAFQKLWDGLNGKRDGCSWRDNPWVAAYTSTVHPQNIDQGVG